jgi:hypothetical protein
MFTVGEFLETLLQGCVVCPPSLMVRRICAEKAGPFRTDLTWGHDWEWTMRLAEQAAVCYVNEPFAAYRVHDASGTAEVLNAAKNGSQERRILRDTLERLSHVGTRFRDLHTLAFRALSHRHMYFAELALLRGKRKIARYNLRYAALANPRILTRPTFWALLLGSVGRIGWYTRYLALRNFSPLTGSP